MERKILKDMQNVNELIYSFENVLCIDDNKTLEEYTDSEIISEAQYILETYSEYGHRNYFMVTGDNGKHEKQIALKEVKQIKAFLNKYSGIQ